MDPPPFDTSCPRRSAVTKPDARSAVSQPVRLARASGTGAQPARTPAVEPARPTTPAAESARPIAAEADSHRSTTAAQPARLTRPTVQRVLPLPTTEAQQRPVAATEPARHAVGSPGAAPAARARPPRPTKAPTAEPERPSATGATTPTAEPTRPPATAVSAPVTCAIAADAAMELPVAAACQRVVVGHQARQAQKRRGRPWRTVPDRHKATRRTPNGRCRRRSRPIGPSQCGVEEPRARAQHGTDPPRRRRNRHSTSGSDPPRPGCYHFQHRGLALDTRNATVATGRAGRRPTRHGRLL